MPRFTREQVRRRQRIAVAALALVLLLVIGGCTALVANLAGGGDTPRRADDAAMTVGATPADAPALTQLPEGAQLTAEEAMGIDVSSYQRDIDWEQVAGDGYVFAYIKATEGTGFVDTHFRQNWDGARAAGITPGAYHYFTLCSSGAEQAASFLAAAPPDDAALPPALDLEFDGACDARPEAADAQAQIDAFTYEVEKGLGSSHGHLLLQRVARTLRAARGGLPPGLAVLGPGAALAGGLVGVAAAVRRHRGRHRGPRGHRRGAHRGAA